MPLVDQLLKKQKPCAHNPATPAERVQGGHRLPEESRSVPLGMRATSGCPHPTSSQPCMRPARPGTSVLRGLNDGRAPVIKLREQRPDFRQATRAHGARGPGTRLCHTRPEVSPPRQLPAPAIGLMAAPPRDGSDRLLGLPASTEIGHQTRSSTSRPWSWEPVRGISALRKHENS